MKISNQSRQKTCKIIHIAKIISNFIRSTADSQVLRRMPIKMKNQIRNMAVQIKLQSKKDLPWTFNEIDVWKTF